MKHFIYLLLLPFLLFAETKHPSFSTGQPPPWVIAVPYELAPATVKPSQVNLQYLLMDTQKHWEEKTSFRRLAIKPLTQAGVEEVSHLKLLFNPAFSHICVHSIRVYRNGVWQDRLSTARQHILQRENNLEMQIYSGLLTLVYFINDIRVGDVVEYQYSYIGGNPLLTTYLDDVVYLEDSASIEKISYRLLVNPALNLEVKTTLTTLVPSIQELSPDLMEWTITATETEARPWEPNQPAATNPCARIQINEYQSWKLVIDQLKPLVILPDNFMDDPSEEILLLLSEWISFDPYERARLATRFVQNEIHYLSLSDGISALKPEDPTICFTRRFGDCKDKTLLLHGLLKLMGIPSTPILVNSSKGAALPSFLPSPHLFNHMILRIELNGEPIFVDPTITLQGGPITANYCPRYFYGLPLSEESSHLIALPEAILLHPVEIETKIELKNDGLLEMNVETHYYGKEAETMRRKLAYQGLRKLSDSHLLYTQQLYRGATSVKPLKVSDDSKQNLFSTVETYQIPLRSKKVNRLLYIQSQLLKDCLETDINPDRKTPYVVTYPLWIKEHIHVNHLSLQESPASEEINFDHECFLYRSSYKRSATDANFNFEINFKKDHILPNEIPSFNEIMSEIESLTDLEVSFNFSDRKGQESPELQERLSTARYSE